MDPPPLTIVAIFRARPGCELDLEQALRALVPPTQKESGCLNYDLHASLDEPGLFYFHETWRSADDHIAHLGTPHVKHILAISPELLREPIRELRGRRLEG